ncbi:DUF2157 domain-containing protein [Flammeovirga sp. EKP202]|uniref:DUF2157 domain-containing protein n=1 Tax=Flammeovirga sp. EKP202 TaxID=2770592 RepID=UPI00165EF0A9|nr:DUF2157 domain-containing protein [Flammeovirga sp. EKP202]MBD0405182.1 DUF2157 domain-containing protein [Flammeovirga sp. EKP202]
MTKLNRNDFQLISKYSDWEGEDLDKALRENVYIDQKQWNTTLSTLLLVFGVGFVAVGIMFFFAYNWGDLSKTLKLAIVETVVVLALGAFLFFRNKTVYANILATCIAFLIGVMFAVFGQVYQTGANAYDFFLGWTMAIALIVFLSDFAVLWLLYLLLISTTWHFYFTQVLDSFHDLYELLLLFILYTLAFVVSHFLSSQNKVIPNWWRYSVILIIVGLGTLISSYIITHSNRDNFISIVSSLSVIIVYVAGLIYALKQRYIVLFASILFSCILLFTNLLIVQVNDLIGSFLIGGVFMVISVTGLVKQVVRFNKKWANE